MEAPAPMSPEELRDAEQFDESAREALRQKLRIKAGTDENLQCILEHCELTRLKNKPIGRQPKDITYVHILFSVVISWLRPRVSRIRL